MSGKKFFWEIREESFLKTINGLKYVFLYLQRWELDPPEYSRTGSNGWFKATTQHVT